MCIATAVQKAAYKPLPTAETEATQAPEEAAERSSKLPAQKSPESENSTKVACSGGEKLEVACEQRTVLSQVLMGVLYVSLWVSLSGATIMYNKWILVFYNFPFPVTLTMWHMGFSALLATICVKAGWVPAEKKMTSEIYLQAVLPVAVLFAGTLFMGNSVYMYLSIAFIQMLKSLGTVGVFSIGCIFGVEKFSVSTLANMVIVTIGVALASYGEIRFVILGVILQVCATVLESTRLILVQVLLQKRGLRLNPILTLYYIAPASFCFLSVLWLFLEKDAFLAHPMDLSIVPILLSNGMIAFGLNLSVFLLIGKTSALSMNVAGVVKDWCLIGLSVFIFGAQLSPMGIAGYSLALAGACWYNYQKLQAMKAQQAINVQTQSGNPAGSASPIDQKLAFKTGLSL